MEIPSLAVHSAFINASLGKIMQAATCSIGVSSALMRHGHLSSQLPCSGLKNEG